MARFFMSFVKVARKRLAQMHTLKEVAKYEEKMTLLYSRDGALSARQFFLIVGLIADREVEIDLANE